MGVKKVGMDFGTFYVNRNKTQKVRMGVNRFNVDTNKVVGGRVYYEGRECKVVDNSKGKIGLVLVTNFKNDYVYVVTNEKI